MNDEKGCYMASTCSFYCSFMKGSSPEWATMIKKYCNGSDFPLCARLNYYERTGLCAPLDMTPIGTLPLEILAEIT